MSQAKVDKYKQEKYNRKHAKKKSNVKKIAAYAAATLVVILFVGYLGYSVAVVTGLYTPLLQRFIESFLTLKKKVFVM